MKATITDTMGSNVHPLNKAVPGTVYSVVRSDFEPLPVGSIILTHYNIYLEQMLCFGISNSGSVFGGMYVNPVAGNEIIVRAYKAGESFTVLFEE